MYTNRKKLNLPYFLPAIWDETKGPIDHISRAVSNRTGLLLFFACFLMFSLSVEAQCAMCRAVLESEGNKSTAEGINNGIVYLMAIPYVLVGVLFYFVYKKIKG
ncbi:hypothetical protein D7Z94_14605 [Ulvibacterium marinum]|uniref:Uncharacterized protein n=2 Tax=Ulvibacterium marinum TaxID=2419782 RepID=A0A3B0C5V5_9FLAO|nr:hypothetical protein D7Z94_14605 [Ulvibacterium marinum]